MSNATGIQAGASPTPQTSNGTAYAARAGRPRGVHSTHVGYRLSFPRILRSEAYKLRTVRSTWWFLGINMLLILGGTVLMSFSLRFLIEQASKKRTPSSPSAVSLQGSLDVFKSASAPWESISAMANMCVVLIAIFAALAYTAEFSTNSIQSTAVAVPRRFSLFWAKTLGSACFVFVTSLVATLISWGITKALFSGIDLKALPSGEELRLSIVVLLGYPLALACASVLGTSVGAIVRSSGIGILVTLGILYLLPEIVSVIYVVDPKRFEWIETVQAFFFTGAVGKFLTAGAGSISADAMDSGAWTPSWWVSGLVVLAWVAVASVVGLLVSKKRDI